jgi:hypothetical protein
MDGGSDAWFDRELAGCSFADERLDKRLRKLVAQIGSAMGQSIPLVCQDWANTKAAYRFFSNDRVSEADILAGHFQSTHGRTVASDGPVLVLHDTTEFTYRRENTDAIGITKSINSGRDKAGRLRSHTICGILMHSSLAVTTEGLPLGLAAVKFWTRKKFKGTAALKKKINPTRVPIEKKESIRWLEKCPAVHGASRRPGTMRPHRRSRERHLRAFLRGPGSRNAFPDQDLCRPLGWRRGSHDRRRNGRGRRQRAAPHRR